LPTAANSGQIDMTGIADRRGCFGQATATGSLEIVNRPLQFDGLADYVLKKVGHGSECRKPVLEIAFMAVLLIYVTPGMTIPAVISEAAS
jgi:hypothetical protein